MSDNKNYSNDLTNNEINSSDSITENNVDKMMQELSNQTYGSTVDDYTNNNYHDAPDNDDNAQNQVIIS